MHNGYLHIAVLIALSPLASAQQPTIEVWLSPATDLDALPGHALDHNELDFMTYFAGCPAGAGGCGLSQECGTTQTYYVWGKFSSVPAGAIIKALHLVAAPSGTSTIEDSVIYRHNYNDGTHVWDRWDNSAPIVMHGDPGLVGYATTSNGNGIRNGGSANPYDLYCYATRTFLIGAIRVSCPLPCASSGLQLGIGVNGFRVFSSGGTDISTTIQLRLCGQTTANPPSGGLPYWNQVLNCTGGFADCNGNDIPDNCDISCNGEGCEFYSGCGHSADCDHNGQPDECQPGIGLPTILQQPTDQTVCVGQAATFTVQAQGVPTPTYQWLKDGKIIAGAKAAAYTIPWADPMDAGAYTVEVTGCGSIISNIATLTMIQKPAVASPPAEQTVTAGADVSFSVSVTGGGTYTYQWRRAALPVSNGSFVSGATTDTLTIQRADAADAGRYDVVITTACGYTVSPHALLTVNPGPCPPCGAPYVTKTYLLTGDANNTPWSWRIESTDGKFTDAVELHVDGVAEGGALAVAQRFAESVNAYAAAHGRGADQLYAIAREAFGRTLLAIRTGGNAGFRLWVGPADQPPSCLVVPEQLPACGFNPTITAVPDPATPNETPPTRPAAQDSASIEPSQSGIGIVSYDLRTGEVARYTLPRKTVDSMLADLAPLLPTDNVDDPGRTLRGDNWLTPVANPSDFSFMCQIHYTQLGAEQVATGCFIEPAHILTSGMVVNTGGDWHWGRGWIDGQWSTSVRVTPEPHGGWGPWNSHGAARLWSFEDFVSRGDTQDMLGIIVLDRPVFDPCDAAPYWRLPYTSCWSGTNVYYDALVLGYPQAPPYTDGHLYSGTVDLHTCGWDRFYGGSFTGMRGAPVLPGEDSSVHWVHAWDDSSSPTRAVPIRADHYEAMWNDSHDNLSPTPDLIPFHLEVEDRELQSGDPLYTRFLIINYSQATFYVDSITVELYLSYGNDIFPSSVLLYQKQSLESLGALDTMEVWPHDLHIPADMPTGTYWIVARVIYDDADPGNNVTNGSAAAEIHVTCGSLVGPSGVSATDGTLQSQVQVTWNPLPGTNVTYDVYRDDDSEPPATPYVSGLTTTAFLDPNVIQGPTYYYWVAAHNECGFASALSAPDTGWGGFTSAPVLVASDGTDSRDILITWDPIPGAESYYVWRADVCDPNLTPSTVYDGSGTSCADPWSTVAGQRYFYFGKAAAGQNESVPSNCEVGWRGVPEPNAPRASDGDSEYYPDCIHIDWDLVPGITHYQVWRAEELDPNTLHPISDWIDAGTWYDADCNDLYAVPGVNYKYYVRGSFYDDGSTAGPLSAADTGWRFLRPPTNVVASDGEYTDEVIITWNATPGGVFFEVYRGTSPDPNRASVLPNPPNPTAWVPETGWVDTTALPGVQYYYWVMACGGRWCMHMTELSVPDTGWRAVDCNGNRMPDPIDPNAIGPTVDQSPLDHTACLGAAATFTVAATSQMALSYQWRHNAVPIPDSNSPTFTISWIDPNDAGSYDVTVANNCGSTTSGAATLTILMPVTITQEPQDVPDIVEIGGSASFSVSATGAAPLSYQWRHGTLPLVDGNDMWGGVISGAQTANLAIANVQTGHAGAYDVIITNTCGEQPSQAGHLAVELGPGPGCGPTFMVSSYEIVGAGEGQDWSWRIDSALGRFTSTPAVTAPGVTGTALDVAQAFAASINDYVQSQGWPPEALAAVATEIAGTVSLALRSSADEPLVLYVGPASGPADARVELPLPPCEFNPLIVQLPLPGADCNANRQDDLLDLLTSTSTDVNLNSRPDECESIGDTNCDGVVSYGDVGPFVIVLNSLAAYEAQYPECDWHNADVNGDGKVSYGDINPFVLLLGGE